MTQVPFFKVLDLLSWLLNCKPCFTVQFSVVFRDSEQVDTAETDLQRVVQGTAGLFWHARWKHKQWGEYLRFRPSCSAAVAAGQTQRTFAHGGSCHFRRSIGIMKTISHFHCYAIRKVWNPK